MVDEYPDAAQFTISKLLNSPEFANHEATIFLTCLTFWPHLPLYQEGTGKGWSLINSG